MYYAIICVVLFIKSRREVATVFFLFFINMFLYIFVDLLTFPLTFPTKLETCALIWFTTIVELRDSNPRPQTGSPYP